MSISEVIRPFFVSEGHLKSATAMDCADGRFSRFPEKVFFSDFVRFWSSALDSHTKDAVDASQIHIDTGSGFASWLQICSFKDVRSLWQKLQIRSQKTDCWDTWRAHQRTKHWSFYVQKIVSTLVHFGLHYSYKVFRLFSSFCRKYVHVLGDNPNPNQKEDNVTFKSQTISKVWFRFVVHCSKMFIKLLFRKKNILYACILVLMHV